MGGRMAKNETQMILLCYRRGFYFYLLVSTQYNLFIGMRHCSFHIFSLLSPPLALPTLPRKWFPNTLTWWGTGMAHMYVEPRGQPGMLLCMFGGGFVLSEMWHHTDLKTSHVASTGWPVICLSLPPWHRDNKHATHPSYSYLALGIERRSSRMHSKQLPSLPSINVLPLSEDETSSAWAIIVSKVLSQWTMRGGHTSLQPCWRAYFIWLYYLAQADLCQM